MPRPRRWSPEDQDDPRLRRNMNSGATGGLVQSIFGPLASPRANPKFDPKTAVETGETPYKKAGFFRRLIGDQSDLMNREFQQQRTGLLIDRNEADYERSKDFETFSKQQQLADQLAKDRFMMEAGQNSVDAISRAEMENQMALQRQKLMIDANRADAEAEALNRLNVARLGYDANMYEATQRGQIANAQLAQEANRPFILPEGSAAILKDSIYQNQPATPSALGGPTGITLGQPPRVNILPRPGASGAAVNPVELNALRNAAGAGRQQGTLVNPIAAPQVPAVLAPQGPAYSQPALVPEYSQGAEILRTLINKYAPAAVPQQPYQPNAIDLGTLLQRKEEEARRRMQRTY